MKHLVLTKILGIGLFLAFSLPAFAQFPNLSGKLVQGKQTTALGITSYSDTVPLHTPTAASWRNNTQIHRDTALGVDYVWRYPRWYANSTVRQSNPPPATRAAGSNFVDFTETLWQNSTDSLTYYYEEKQQCWQPVGTVVRDTTPVSTAATGTSAAVCYEYSLWYNSTNDSLYAYTAGAWLAVGSGGGGTASAVDSISVLQDSIIVGYSEGIEVTRDSIGYPAGFTASDSTAVRVSDIANVKIYGALGDGSDATTAFQNAIATEMPVYIPLGRYRISDTLYVNTGQRIFGDGEGSILEIAGGGIVFFVNTTNTAIENLRIVGKSGAGIFQTGIRIDDPATSNAQFNRVENVTIDSILYQGIRMESAYTNYRGNLIQGCKFRNNATGLYLNGRAEYTLINNCVFNANTVGVYLAGGNNIITGCNISNNTIGIQIATATNELHGLVSDCLINHNSSAGISASGTTLEHQFLGCSFYYSDIQVSNCDNFKFNNCTFSNDTLRFTNSDGHYFVGNEFVSTITKDISTSTVYFINNKNSTGSGEYGAFPTTTGQYVLDVTGGAHSYVLNSGGTTYTGSNGVTLNTTDFRLGGTSMGAASTFSATRKINTGTAQLIIGGTADSTLFYIDPAQRQVRLGDATGNATAKLFVQGHGGNIMQLRTAAGLTPWLSQSDGKHRFSDFVYAPYFVASDQYSATFPTAFSATAGGLTINAGSGGNGVYITTQLNNTDISGSYSVVKAGNTFAPTSSSAQYGVFRAQHTINQTGGASGITYSYKAEPTLTSAADYRGFYSAATSGRAFYQEGANATNYFAGNTGIGTTSPDQKLHSELSDAVTNAISFPLRLTHITSGTAAAGSGAGLEFEAESAGGTNRVAGTIENPFTTATNAAEVSDLVFRTMRAGTLTESLRSLGNGALQIGTLSGTGTQIGGWTAGNIATTLTEGYGLNITGGALLVDTTQVATPSDLAGYLPLTLTGATEVNTAGQNLYFRDAGAYPFAFMNSNYWTAASDVNTFVDIGSTSGQIQVNSAGRTIIAAATNVELQAGITGEARIDSDSLVLEGVYPVGTASDSVLVRDGTTGRVNLRAQLSEGAGIDISSGGVVTTTQSFVNDYDASITLTGVTSTADTLDADSNVKSNDWGFNPTTNTYTYNGVTGRYYSVSVSAQVSTPTGAGENFIIEVFRNGTVTSCIAQTYLSAVSVPFAMHGQSILLLSNGDTINAKVSSTAAGGEDFDIENYSLIIKEI
jgi:hypothetical protein